MTNKQINFKFQISNFKFLLIIFAYLFICLFVYSGNVRAQQVSLGLSPPLLEAVMKPGKSIMIAYTLENSGDPTPITVRVASFEPKDNLGNIRLKNEFEGPIRFTLDNADIQMDSPFFLKTGASQQLLVRIRVPEGAPSGDYYYSLLAETTPGAALEGIDIAQAKATIGSNILITVTDSGVVDVKSKVVLFDVLSKIKFNFFGQTIKIFDSFDKIPVVLILENKGKNLIKPAGEIVLKNGLGLTSKYDLVPKNILAQSQRLVEATPSAVFDKQPVSLVLNGFFVGKYDLSADVNFGENSPLIFASTAFFAFPFKLTLGLIITLIITIYIIKRFSKDE